MRVASCITLFFLGLLIMFFLFPMLGAEISIPPKLIQSIVIILGASVFGFVGYLFPKIGGVIFYFLGFGDD